MLEKLTEAKKPDHIRNYLLPLLGKALSQEKQSHLQVITGGGVYNIKTLQPTSGQLQSPNKIQLNIIGYNL